MKNLVHCQFISWTNSCHRQQSKRLSSGLFADQSQDLVSSLYTSDVCVALDSPVTSSPYFFAAGNTDDLRHAFISLPLRSLQIFLFASYPINSGHRMSILHSIIFSAENTGFARINRNRLV